MQSDVSQILSLLLSSIFVIVIAWGVYTVSKGRKDIPHIISLLPADLQKIVNDAAAFGSELVEQMDKQGQLTALLNDLKPKAEQKMDLAIDYAVQYVEGIFAKNGFPVDIDQEALKAVIQKYVWDNPDLFTSSTPKAPVPPAEPPMVAQ